MQARFGRVRLSQQGVSEIELLALPLMKAFGHESVLKSFQRVIDAFFNMEDSPTTDHMNVGGSFTQFPGVVVVKHMKLFFHCGEPSRIDECRGN